MRAIMKMITNQHKSFNMLTQVLLLITALGRRKQRRQGSKQQKTITKTKTKSTPLLARSVIYHPPFPHTNILKRANDDNTMKEQQSFCYEHDKLYPFVVNNLYMVFCQPPISSHPCIMVCMGCLFISFLVHKNQHTYTALIITTYK